VNHFKENSVLFTIEESHFENFICSGMEHAELRNMILVDELRNHMFTNDLVLIMCENFDVS
jgi:hypothetical protein